MTASPSSLLLVTAPTTRAWSSRPASGCRSNFAYVRGPPAKAGAEVEIYDAMSLFASHEDIRKKIEDFKPDLVGTTAITPPSPTAASSAHRQRPGTRR